MPELPEVQTVVNELREEILYHQILSIDATLSRGIDSKINNIKSFKIDDVSRRGKYIIFSSGNSHIVSHLRMTGKFIFAPDERDTKHIRAVFNLSNKRKMYFVDVRKFGTIEITNDLISFFNKLGPEPFSESFNKEYLYDLFKNKKRPIKNSLLDQNIVAGIGNIYADESLFLSKINPFKESGNLKKTEIALLIQSIKFILQKSINNMGTTLSDYRTTKNIGGENKNYLNVYGSENNPCKVCGNKISRKKLAGRSTHFCPTCQI